MFLWLVIAFLLVVIAAAAIGVLVMPLISGRSTPSAEELDPGAFE